MHLFISAGEPSGDLHGSNLVRTLRQQTPNARLVGFGGEKMAAEGVELLYPLTQLSVMWLSRSIINLPKFFQLADQAERYFRQQRPDAVVLIDYPGFHWHLAKRATNLGIPVYYFVPPQIWAWGGWRIRKMRKTVDTVLTALPFEDVWLRRRGMETHYVGHPYFDELAEQQLDATFVAEQRQRPGPIVALLPGSRNQEVSGNLPLMLQAAQKVQANRPDARFLIAAFNERQATTAQGMVESTGLAAEVHVQRTAEIIELATASLAVSGSVGLELMYRTTPSVIVYRYSRLAKHVSRQLMTTRWISLVNLLANETIFPEYLTYRDESSAMAGHLLGWLNQPAEREAVVAKLQRLKERVAVPGACARAAAFLRAAA